MEGWREGGREGKRRTEGAGHLRDIEEAPGIEMVTQTLTHNRRTRETVHPERNSSSLYFHRARLIGASK